MWGVILSSERVSKSYENLENVKHIFTHKIWDMTPYIVEYSGEELPEGRFFHPSEFKEIPIAKAFQKILEQIK